MLAIVARLQPVTFRIPCHDCFDANIRPIAALRCASSGRALERPLLSPSPVLALVAAIGRHHPRCRQLQSHHSQPTRRHFQLEPFPVLGGQARESIDLLD